jgi:hypothetical protein
VTVEYIPFGEKYPNLDSDCLKESVARNTLAICQGSKDFEIIELRHLQKDDGKTSDVIVVDCVNDQVPSRNPVGIKTRERLALVFTPGQAPEVRALRKDFPVVSHLHSTPLHEPAWLCLYFEPWTAVERNWTPQIHLRRILWWLSETAKGRLHREDQPLEALYYNSPYEIVLPPNFDEKVKNPSLSLTFNAIELSSGGFKTVRGVFVPRIKAQADRIPGVDILMFQLPPVIHGVIERYPDKLGELHDQFKARGAPFLEDLKNLIREKTPQKGLIRNPAGTCLLILSVPVKREAAVDYETYDVRAFLLMKDLATLGETTGALTLYQGKLFVVPLLGGVETNEAIAWRETSIFPIEVKWDVTKGFARKASNIDEKTANFKGVLAGVGALGSTIADLWAKECWGEWTFIDNDFLKTHNVVRHIARNLHIGQLKVDVVKKMVEMNYHDGYYLAKAVASSATNWTNPEVKDAITEADLLIDATTSLEVPREFSQRDDVPRSASVFLTPSGCDSVLIIEDANRKVRLDCLEVQYYRAIINSVWGENHLDGHGGTLWVGAGCRDISAIISNETILLHAATLSKQLRLLRSQPESRIRIWSTDKDNSGILKMHEFQIYEPLHYAIGEWRVVLDKGIHEKLCKMRNSHLPSETGGVILGYVDQIIKAIYVVDVLQAPPDSEADETGFTRGVEGLEAILNEIYRRTAYIVGYLGEWHSHTAFSSAYPSPLDRILIETLAQTLAFDGQPALMVIVGSAGELSISVKGG